MTAKEKLIGLERCANAHAGCLCRGELRHEEQHAHERGQTHRRDETTDGFHAKNCTVAGAAEKVSRIAFRLGSGAPGSSTNGNVLAEARSPARMPIVSRDDSDQKRPS